MEWEEISERLETQVGPDGWVPMTWPRTSGGESRFRVREQREHRKEDRIRVFIHPEDQNVIGCAQVEFVHSDPGEHEEVYFVRDVPTVFIDEPDSSAGVP